ncbi:FtsX-like permease family protein [Actinoplanes sp. NPDC051494]|uniref:FtsX-like permease family protein n=1 Tax=Actinoplanes sp. NPDC051494 TaxID=3363907 RepID=UPI0037BB7090
MTPAPAGVRRWLFELALGARMSAAGGRAGWFRLALIATGVGLGVAVLLGAATVPAAVAASNARTDSREIGYERLPPPGDDTLLTSELETTFGTTSISGVLLEPEGSHPPLPPGVSRMPGPGQIVVSPALAELLREPGSTLLRERWDADVIGVIDTEGLSGPAEYFFYLGTDTLRPGIDTRIREFGTLEATPDRLPMFTVLALVAMVGLLIPVMVFVAGAVRIGDQARDRRLAALRMVGADAAMTRRIAAGETLTGAVLGLLAGALLWAGGIRLATRYAIGPMSFFPADLRPVPILVAAIVIAVPAVTVLVTLTAMRGVVVEPLGVIRMSAEVRRGLWWRLIPPALGLVLLWPLRRGLDEAPAGYEKQVVGGVAFLLIGIALLLPWLVEAVVRRLGGGSTAWELAVRRLQLDSGPAIRAVSGIAVSVAGVIALQGIVAGVESFQARAERGPSARYDVEISSYAELPDRTWTTALDATPGVREHQVLKVVRGEHDTTFQIGACPVLQQLAAVGECHDGDVFAVGADAPGTTYALGDARIGWTAPTTTRIVTHTSDTRSTGVDVSGGNLLLITPAALGGAVPEPSSTFYYAALDPGVPQAREQVRNTAAGLDLESSLFFSTNDAVVPALTEVRRALMAGAVGLLLLIGAALLITVADQLRERRRALAVLVAFGTRRRTLGASILYQVAIPVVLGMLLAVTVGTTIAVVLMLAVGAPPAIDWPGIATTSGTAALVILGATAAGLPALWRLTRSANLRTE